MLNSKNILSGFIVLIILYIVIKFNGTYRAINDANDKFNEDKTPFFIKNNPKIAQQIKNKAINDELKTKEIQKVSVKISGKIDKGMSYMITSTYQATSDKKECIRDNHSLWNAGSYKATESFEYYPELEGTHHNTIVPLDVFNPKEKCKFKIIRVYIDIFSRDNKRERSHNLLFSDNQQELSNERYEINYDDSHKIDMECLEPSIFPLEHYTPCGYRPLTDRFSIAKNIPTKSLKYEINIRKLMAKGLSKDDLRLIELGSMADTHRKRVKSPNIGNSIRF